MISKKKLVIFFNFIFLFINIFFYFNNKFLVLKNSDLYIFLHRKNIKNKKNLSLSENYEKKINKKKITIDCKDTLNDVGCFINNKKELELFNFMVEKDDNTPDFLIYDVFGCKHTDTKYNKSIKIARYSENIIPDFSEADYSIGQAHIIYMDRYFKYPSFIYRLNLLRKYKGETIESFAKNK